MSNPSYPATQKNRSCGNKLLAKLHGTRVWNKSKNIFFVNGKCLQRYNALVLVYITVNIRYCPSFTPLL